MCRAVQMQPIADGYAPGRIVIVMTAGVPNVNLPGAFGSLADPNRSQWEGPVMRAPSCLRVRKG